jgi:hypothetical protein
LASSVAKVRLSNYAFSGGYGKNTSCIAAVFRIWGGLFLETVAFGVGKADWHATCDLLAI